MGDRQAKLLILVTVDWYFWTHRLSLAKAAQDAGMEVVVVTRTESYRERMEEEGFKVVEWKNDRKSINPLRELGSLVQLVQIYRKENPDLVHHVSIKPVVYGGIAARLTGIRARVATITGLGYVFIGTSLKARLLQPLVLFLLRLGLSGENLLAVFQNTDDLKYLVNNGVVDKTRTALIRGSGVDTDLFRYRPEPTGIPTVVLVSRLLWDKGVGEFVEAARCIKKRGIEAKFVLVGERDKGNSTAVPAERLKDWINEGVVEVWGYREDMPKVFEGANIVCLPSYGEGLPKVLMEAASCGRAIVTSDVPGCRDVVKDRDNGLLVAARDSRLLAEALEELIPDPELRISMGRRGRERAVKEFSQEAVISASIRIYRELLLRSDTRNDEPSSSYWIRRVISERVDRSGDRN